MGWWNSVGCGSFMEEIYGDVKTTGNNARGHIVRGQNLRGHNVWGNIVPVQKLAPPNGTSMIPPHIACPHTLALVRYDPVRYNPDIF
jgi:hypothetical protein